MAKFVAVALLMGFGCGQAAELEPERCIPLDAGSIDPAGAHYSYVVDAIDMPSTSAEAWQLGFDLDGDPDGRPNNALGRIAIIAFDAADLDPDAEVNALVRAGAILHLLELRTTSLRDAAGASLTLMHGIDADGDPDDNFSGTEEFAVDEVRGSGTVSGEISEGTLSASIGTLPVAVTFPGLGEPFVLHLVGAKVEVTVEADRLVGRIGGGVTNEEVDAVLMPIFSEGFNRIVDDDCDETGCVQGSAGEVLLQYFDSDEDGVIEPYELRSSDLMSSLLSPDLDLFDETGALNPRCDEVKDSLSVGIGFTAVPAVVVQD